MSMNDLTAAIQAELMTYWRNGMRKGLQTAGEMAQAVADHPDTSDEQRAVLRGLRAALEDAAQSVTKGNQP